MSISEFLQRRKLEKESVSLKSTQEILDPGGIKSLISTPPQSRSLPARDMSKDVISAGKPEEVSLPRKILRASPINIGFEKNVYDPVAKVAKFIFPSYDDYLRDALEENPKRSMEQLNKRATELAVDDGWAPLGDGEQMLSPLDTVNAPGVAGTAMKVAPGIRRAIRKITQAVTEEQAQKVALQLTPDETSAQKFAKEILKAKTEKEAEVVFNKIQDEVTKLTPENRVSTFLKERKQQKESTQAVSNLNTDPKNFKSAEKFVKAHENEIKNTLFRWTTEDGGTQIVKDFQDGKVTKDTQNLLYAFIEKGSNPEKYTYRPENEMDGLARIITEKHPQGAFQKNLSGADLYRIFGRDVEAAEKWIKGEKDLGLVESKIYSAFTGLDRNIVLKEFKQFISKRGKPREGSKTLQIFTKANLKPGQEITYNRPISTFSERFRTYDYEEEYLSHTFGENKIIIEPPKETDTLIDLRGFGQYQREREVLLPPGTTIKVKEIVGNNIYADVNIPTKAELIRNYKLKTRTQLEDIWKQANGKTGSSALLEEAKGKGRSEFVFSPKFEYHLSTSPNLKEGAYFADLPKAKDAGARGGGGESIFTTKNPQAWHSQLAFEQNAETPNHVYLVEVKNPNMQRMQIEGSIPVDLQTVSNPNEVRILKKLGTVPNNKSLEAGLFESEKNKYLEDIWKQANQPINTKLQAFKAGKPSPEGGYIANPFQGKPKQLVDNQGVSLVDDTIGKNISPIDKAIAENKIRVVSRNGRDVYQVKKGGTWVNKRDEDSALKAIAPKIKQEKKYVEVDPEIEMRLVSAMVRKETLDEDPARQLAKFVAKTGENKGVLPEVTGLTKGKFAGRGDTFITELGYKDTEEARQAYLDYAKRKADVMAELKDAKLAIKEARVEEKLKQEGKTPAEIYSPVFPKSQITPEEVKSLEEVANQLKEETVLPPSKTGLSLKEIITQTPLSAKVNMLDYIRTPNRVLEKIGFKKEADLLRLKYDDYLKELPKNIDIITNWYKQVPKDAGERIFNYLDGVDVTLLGNEKRVADEIKDYLSKWADRLDLPKDKRITNYITHIFDDQLIAKEFDEDLAKIIDDKIAGEVYDPFLQKRLGAMGYKKDVWLALDAYTKRATRKVHMDKALEKLQAKAGSSLEYSNLEKSQFEYIKNYIDRVNMRPTDIDNLLDTTIKQMFGYKLGQRPVNSISRVMRQMTYRGFLGANIGSALRNLSQGVNTYAILGERDTALGYLKLFNKENWDELAKEGVLENNFIQDRAISATKKTLEKADKALWLLFSTAEKINRGSAYLGAKNKALRKGMTEEESIKFAKDIVSKTQFNYDAIETPVALSSDLVKTLLQFQTYTTKQTEFLLELAKDRNFAGLARYALGGLAFVYSIGQAFEMDEKELLPINNDTFSRFELAPSAKFFKEVMLAGVNAPNEYGGERTTEQKMKDITASMWGLVPGGLQAKKTIQGAEAIEEGGSYDVTGKKQFEVGGTPAKDIQALLFGKYANEEAKQYFDKTTGDEVLDELKKEDKTSKNEKTKIINEEFMAISKLDKSEQKQYLFNLAKEDEEIAEAVLDKMIEEKKNLTPVEKSLVNSSVKVRAEYIANEIKGLSKEEQKKRVLYYAEKGILTEDVLDELLIMLE